jgi:hypothetical protein
MEDDIDENEMWEKYFCEFTNEVNATCDPEDPSVIKYHKLYGKALKHAMLFDFKRSNWYYLKLMELTRVNY